MEGVPVVDADGYLVGFVSEGHLGWNANEVVASPGGSSLMLARSKTLGCHRPTGREAYLGSRGALCSRTNVLVFDYENGRGVFLCVISTSSTATTSTG